MSSATDAVAAADFDPFSPDLVADPYPCYAGLHAGPRVLYQEQWDIWVLSRHGDVSAALRDHSRLSSANGITYINAPLPMMLTKDPPDHERLRRIVGREFAPRDIHRFRPDIERFVTEGIDAMVGSEIGDIVESIALPVPLRVMARILGVPDGDLPELRRMANDLVHGFKLAPAELTPGQRSDEIAANFDFMRIGGAITEILGYFSAMVGRRRAAPEDDLVTKLIQPAEDAMLDEEELLWFCLLLLVAGIETTTNLIGNMTIALAGHPDQWDVLKARTDLVGSAVNEALRFDAPIQGFYRTSLAPYAIGDVEIPSGSRVLLSFGAANRDPIRYPDADTFRADRDPTDHLALGGGIHRCLGAGLAELEGRIVLEQLLERADEITIAGQVVRTTNPTLRGARSVPVATKGWR